MAPKRSARNIQTVATINNNTYDKLLLSDVLCPICRTVLIEPVTLPCNHGFCLSCFNSSMEHTNLVCPLCRLRISSWLRLSKKDNKLINKNLWDAIQKSFSQSVKEKLQGNEQFEEDEIQRRITSAGEIRVEYEIEKAKELETQQKEQEAELKATQQYLKTLKEQEEYEECVKEENLRLSEQLARKLSNDYCFDPGPSSSKVTAPLVNYKKQVPIDKFLKNIPKTSISKEHTTKISIQGISATNTLEKKNLANLFDKHVKRKFGKILEDTCDSNDSITSECRYFKPIDRKYVPLATKTPIIKVPAVTADATTVIIGAPKGNTKFTHSVVNSPFAVVKFIHPVNSSSNITEAETLNPAQESQLVTDSIDIDSTFMKINVKKQPTKFKEILDNRWNGRHTGRPLIYSTTNINKPDTSSVSDINKVDLVLQSISKRKRSVSSPSEENIPNKLTKIPDTVSESPIISRSTRSENLNYNSDDSKTITNHHQEEGDFQLALKLHKQLNNANRYPVRNNISIHIRNTRKSARQVTLKEIISQTTST